MPTGISFEVLKEDLKTEELVKKLKSIHKKLEGCESKDDASSSSLQSLATSLVQSYLISHRTKEVKSLVACVLADVFRVCYPKPPYDESERRDIFILFVNQLEGLKKPSAPSFKYSFQLLESLATIRLLNLSIEMEDQDIISDIFKTLFSVVGHEVSTSVRNYISDILSALVQDAESLPQEVIDTILSNILEPKKSENKFLYSFTADFIRKTSSHIEPYIHLFFNNALTVGKSSESEVADSMYDLILELHTIDSTVLLAVMPQLEYKLRSTDTEERTEVTKLLAKMFSLKGSKLAVENRPLWICFLGRFMDVSPHIRVECARYSKRFLVYHPHLVDDIAAKLHDSFYDKEEKVRLEVVTSVCEAAAEKYEVISQVLRDDLKERMRDKMWNIRKVAISNLSRIYRQLMSSSFSSSSSVNQNVKELEWIPTKVLHCYYRDTMEDRLCVERCLLSCLVPINLPEKDRMDRLIHVYTSLDVHAVRAFDALLISRYRIRGQLQETIHTKQDAELSSEKKKELLNSQISQLSKRLPDSSKARPYLDYLVESMDTSLRENLLQAIDTSCSCGDVIQAKVNVLSRVGSKSGVVETVKNLLDRACPMIIDGSCVRILVSKACGELEEPALGGSQEEEDVETHKAKCTLRLIKVLAEVMPNNFSASEVCERLVVLLRQDDCSIVRTVLQILTLVGEYISKEVSGCLQPILMKLAQQGDMELAKDAIKCMGKVFKDPQPVLRRLFSFLLDHLDYDDDNFRTVLVCLGQMAKLHPLVFATKDKEVIAHFVMKELISVDKAQGEFVEGEPEWVPDGKVSFETQSKVLGLKLLVKWLQGMASAGDSLRRAAHIHEKQCRAVMKVLEDTLASDGDLQGMDNLRAHDRSRLRLAAACGILRLARCSCYKKFITHSIFQTLALTTQDSCEQIREKFVQKLDKYLSSFQLPLEYLSIMVYAGLEPNKSRRDRFHKVISSNVSKRKQCINQLSNAKDNLHIVLPEYAVSHAVYLVAHHPHFSRTKSSNLDKFKDSLWFFLEPMLLRGENYGFLKKLIETIKATVDAQNPTNAEMNKNLYAACDLTMGVMGTKLLHIAIGDYSGEIVLSSDYFKTKGKAARPNEIRYLPPEYSCTPSKHPKTTSTTMTNSSPSPDAEEIEGSAGVSITREEKLSPSKRQNKSSKLESKPTSRARSRRGRVKKTEVPKRVVATRKIASGSEGDQGTSEEEESGPEEVENVPSAKKSKVENTSASSRNAKTVQRTLQVSRKASKAAEVSEESEVPPAKKAKVSESKKRPSPQSADVLSESTSIKRRTRTRSRR